MQRLWLDEYRPTRLQDLDFHEPINALLEQLAKKDDFPHILMCGPDGTGKKTRAMCFLERVYGSGVYRVKCVTKIFKLEGTSTDVEYSMLESNHHFDITPSHSDRNDRHVINNAIKQSAEMGNVEKAEKFFKVIIVNEADKLSKEAQASLRRTMEKYTETCRLILICESMHKLMAPIRSRCLSIKFKSPEASPMYKVISNIVKQEGITAHIGEPQITQLINISGHNIRKALLALQLAASYPEFRKVTLDEWKEQVQKIVKTVMNNQSQEAYKLVEENLYKMLINGIDSEEILKELLDEFLKSNPQDKMAFGIIHQAAETERNMNLGDKPVFHLFAFVVRIIAMAQSNQ